MQIGTVGGPAALMQATTASAKPEAMESGADRDGDADDTVAAARPAPPPPPADRGQAVDIFA